MFAYDITAPFDKNNIISTGNYYFTSKEYQTKILHAIMSYPEKYRIISDMLSELPIDIKTSLLISHVNTINKGLSCESRMRDHHEIVKRFVEMRNLTELPRSTQLENVNDILSDWSTHNSFIFRGFDFSDPPFLFVSSDQGNPRDLQWVIRKLADAIDSNAI